MLSIIQAVMRLTKVGLLPKLRHSFGGKVGFIVVFALPSSIASQGLLFFRETCPFFFHPAIIVIRISPDNFLTYRINYPLCANNSELLLMSQLNFIRLF